MKQIAVSKFVLAGQHSINIESALGRRGGPMVIVLDSGSSGPGSGIGRGHCVVFLCSYCLSSPRCINGYRRNAGGNPAMD